MMQGAFFYGIGGKDNDRVNGQPKEKRLDRTYWCR